MLRRCAMLVPLVLFFLAPAPSTWAHSGAVDVAVTGLAGTESLWVAGKTHPGIDITPSVDARVRYATYLSGPAGYSGTAIAADSHDNVYIGGSVTRNDAPVPANAALPYRTTGGFVVKLAAGGTRLDYRLFLPGSVAGVAVDGHGNVYVTGWTSAAGFPTQHADQPYLGGGTCGWSGLTTTTGPCRDAFVTKLSPAGRILYSTYLGGSADDAGTAIAVTPRGDAYVTGWTGSSDFPLRHAIQSRYAGPFHGQVTPAGTDLSPCCDAFVAKLNADGKLLFSTYLGGSGVDGSTGISVDRSGNAYVAGATESADFPVANAFQSKMAPVDPDWGWASSAFVTKLSPADTIVYSTYFGGSGPTTASGIGVDGRGNTVIAGSTVSKTMPVRHAIQTTILDPHSSDPFVAGLDPAGQLVYSTYLGGTAYGEAHAVTATVRGQAIVVGRVEARDFPTVRPLRGVPVGGPFVSELSAHGSPLRFSSFLGTLTVHAVAADRRGDIYLTGDTPLDVFLTAGRGQRAPAGNTLNAFVIKIHPGN